MSSFRLTQLLLLSVTTFTLIHVSHARSVNINVYASWPKFSVSPIAEVSEFVSEQSNSKFWNYIDGICDKSERVEFAVRQNSLDSLLDIQSLAIDAASALIPKFLLPLMETSVGLGSFLPAVEFFRALADDFGDPCNGNSFFIVYPGGALHCNYSDSSLFITENSKIMDITDEGESSWDHIFEASEDDASLPPVKVVLYGSIGTSSFCTLHSQIKSLAEKNLVQYSTRHAFPGLVPLSNVTHLQGYGVFLDIKNMEYKTIDDSSVSATSDNEGKGENANILTEDEGPLFLEGEETEGLIFSKLHSRRPHLADELKRLKTELEKSRDSNQDTDSSQDMKVRRSCYG